MKLEARPTALRCAYCRDDLGPAVLTCVACRTLIHEECELDACPTLGCGSLAPWELVRSDRREPTVPELVAFGLLVALVAATGTVAVLLVAWPGRSAAATPRAARPAPGPDPDVPAIDPWLWWAPGSEIVVRTRVRQVRELRWFATGPGGCESGTTWEPVIEEYEQTIRLEETTAYEAVVATTSSGFCRRVERRPLDMPAEEAVEEPSEGHRGVAVTLPIGAIPVRYRSASINLFELGLSWSSWPHDGTEELWTDPRIPVPLRRLVTWQVLDAPPDCQTGSLESVIVAIRGQAAIR